VLGGVFATAGKVLLPMVGLAALVLQGGTVSPTLRNAALFGVVGLLGVLALFVTVMVSGRAAHAVGGFLQRVAEASLRLVRRPRALGWEQGIARLREQTRDVVRTGWLQMTLGTLGYFVAYFILFWLCLHICGLVAGVGTLLAAFALGRLLTSVAVTPGGLGVVEAGSVALLVAMGADPAQAASGILLFTIFTHVLEIPFGVVAWLAWLWGREKKLPIKDEIAASHHPLDDAEVAATPAGGDGGPGPPNG
jgi:uncharacterized protein (TIRG00374 family)